MANFPVASQVWVHQDREDAWDVYEPTLKGLKALRPEPYVWPLEPRG